MESAIRTREILNNAEEVKNTRMNLNNWVKELKDKEQKLNIENNTEYVKSQPIRSHISQNQQMGMKTNGNVITENKLIIEAEDDQQNGKEKADIFKDRGNNHVKLGEHEKAILNYTEAIDAYDGDPKFFTNRALCYLKLERYDECIDDCNRAIELDKLNVKAYYRRMQANESLGFNTQALKDCTTVLMIDSKNREAKTSLQRINQRLKKTGAVPKGYPTTEPSIKEGPHFSPLRSNMVDILPVNKIPNTRSKKQLKLIPIIDVVGPKDGKNYENSNIQISDEVIDKIFNGEYGSYEEVKTSDKINVKEIEKDGNSNSIQEKIVIHPPTESKSEAESTLVTKPTSLPMAPKSTAQFYCNWKELSPEQKYHYLKSIEVPRLNKILGACFDSDTLTDLLTIFKEFYMPNKDSLCEKFIEICKNDRLKILSLMLSAEDKEALSDALNYIKESASEDDLDLIKKSFNL